MNVWHKQQWMMGRRSWCFSRKTVEETYKLKTAPIAVFRNMSSAVKVFNFAFQASSLKSFYYQQHPQPSCGNQQISRETLTGQG